MHPVPSQSTLRLRTPTPQDTLHGLQGLVAHSQAESPTQISSAAGSGNGQDAVTEHVTARFLEPVPQAAEHSDHSPICHAQFVPVHSLVTGGSRPWQVSARHVAVRVCWPGPPHSTGHSPQSEVSQEHADKSSHCSSAAGGSPTQASPGQTTGRVRVPCPHPVSQADQGNARHMHWVTVQVRREAGDGRGQKVGSVASGAGSTAKVWRSPLSTATMGMVRTSAEVALPARATMATRGWPSGGVSTTRPSCLPAVLKVIAMPASPSAATVAGRFSYPKAL
mmetsp:Transcript_27860/g.72093  ORF Transcript_27860/g.72093 Transcript_27860/m.72093 type:complete len:279 (-) Transcript_27860:86-922(-)